MAVQAYVTILKINCEEGCAFYLCVKSLAVSAEAAY